MPLNPVRIVKGWFRNNQVEPEHWDELVNKFGAFATETLNNLKQLGLDLGGATYDFNNVGKKTQTTNVIARLDLLEKASLIGTSNLGINISTNTTVGLFGGDGTALSTTNVAQVVVNDSDNAGQAVIYELSATQSVTLTGAHWGFGGTGDLTDYPLWVYLIDISGVLVLGVSATGGLQSVASADCKTTASDVTSRTHILCASTVGGAANCLIAGWVKANFDDTGGVSEDLWQIAASQGDTNLGLFQGYNEATALRF